MLEADGVASVPGEVLERVTQVARMGFHGWIVGSEERTMANVSSQSISTHGSGSRPTSKPAEARIANRADRRCLIFSSFPPSSS